jgi:hypothetical protein
MFAYFHAGERAPVPRRAAAPPHRGLGRRDLRRAGLGRRPGRLRRNHPGPRPRRGLRAHHPRWHGPGDHRRRHARLADHPHRDRRSSGRGPPPRYSWTAPGLAAGPPPSSGENSVRPRRIPTRPGSWPQSRSSRPMGVLARVPPRRQNTQICSHQQTSAQRHPATQNGGYLKSPADNAWQAAVSAA